MKINILFNLFLFSLAIYACENIKETTKSGYEIEFIEKGSEVFYADSSVLFMNIQYTDENGKEIFSSKADGRPLIMPYRTATWGIAPPYAGPFYEIIAACKVADSIQFKLNAKDMYVHTLLFDSVPPELELSDSSLISFYVRIDSQKTEQGFKAFMEAKRALIEAKDIEAQERTEKEFQERKIVEDSLIRQYLKEKNITTMSRTESGLWYEITEQGTGDFPVENDLVKIHYYGYFLDDTLFDSSYEKEGGKPIRFAFGVNDVLRGWDQGLGLLRLGGKATFILPSHLAHGSSSTESIKPYTILRYEVELLKIIKRGEGFVLSDAD